MISIDIDSFSSWELVKHTLADMHRLTRDPGFKLAAGRDLLMRSVSSPLFPK